LVVVCGSQPRNQPTQCRDPGPLLGSGAALPGSRQILDAEYDAILAIWVTLDPVVTVGAKRSTAIGATDSGGIRGMV
ncbi:MAG TPA: hypothetical protein VKJ45_17315, partial [Blastocatellia bacterium]|nr:hypothetical protein [Blastocatellia bacterium]